MVRRRGAEEAGAIYIRIDRLNGTSDLFGPAPQSEVDSGRGDRSFVSCLAQEPSPDAAVVAVRAACCLRCVAACRALRSTAP